MNRHHNLLFPARIGRASFLARGLLVMLGGFLAGLLLSSAHHAHLVAKLICLGGGAAAMLLFLVALFRSLLVPRLKDIGVHPAWSLLFFVHALSGLFLLALLLVPTDAFANRRRYAW